MLRESTHSQVLTGTRAGGTAAAKCCARDLRTRGHWKHRQRVKERVIYQYTADWSRFCSILVQATLHVNTPGQWFVLQLMTSVPRPSQKLPSPTGAGLSHSLLRERTPPPHDLVHSVQLLH